MTEGPPKLPTPEKKEGLITKQQVVERLRTNPEDVTPLNEYLDLREAEVTTIQETLQLNIEVAEIYRDAGRTTAAQDAFRDAADQAWHHYDDERHTYCMAELQKLGG